MGVAGGAAGATTTATGIRAAKGSGPGGAVPARGGSVGAGGSCIDMRGAGG